MYSACSESGHGGRTATTRGGGGALHLRAELVAQGSKRLVRLGNDHLLEVRYDLVHALHELAELFDFGRRAVGNFAGRSRRFFRQGLGAGPGIRAGGDLAGG